MDVALVVCGSSKSKHAALYGSIEDLESRVSPLSSTGAALLCTLALGAQAIAELPFPSTPGPSGERVLFSRKSHRLVAQHIAQTFWNERILRNAITCREIFLRADDATALDAHQPMLRALLGTPEPPAHPDAALEALAAVALTLPAASQAGFDLVGMSGSTVTTMLNEVLIEAARLAAPWNGAGASFAFDIVCHQRGGVYTHYDCVGRRRVHQSTAPPTHLNRPTTLFLYDPHHDASDAGETAPYLLFRQALLVVARGLTEMASAEVQRFPSLKLARLFVYAWTPEEFEVAGQVLSTKALTTSVRRRLGCNVPALVSVNSHAAAKRLQCEWLFVCDKIVTRIEAIKLFEHEHNANQVVQGYYLTPPAGIAMTSLDAFTRTPELGQIGTALSVRMTLSEKVLFLVIVTSVLLYIEWHQFTGWICFLNNRKG